MEIKGARPVVVVAMLALVVGFAAGYGARGSSRIDLTIYKGDGYVGTNQATLTADGTSYGFEGTVPWTAVDGTQHSGDWPACLPHLQSVEGVKFGGAVVWHGNSGVAEVLWVDCRG